MEHGSDGSAPGRAELETLAQGAPERRPVWAPRGAEAQYV